NCSMKICESCGDELDTDYCLAVCPKCLFADALSVEDVAEEASGASDPTSGLLSLGRIAARRDFFEKYDLQECLKRGGQGEVLQVWDFDLRRSVAMKRLADPSSSSAPAVYRFLAEAQIAGQLEHPGILPVYDVGLDPDRRPFFTTSLLPGTSLA